MLLAKCVPFVLQTMNMLMVYQSVVDTLASFLTLMIAAVEPDNSRMSADNVSDQVVCHVWIGRQPLWYVTFISTYGIVLMTFDRYCAVVYPFWYNNNVSNLPLIFNICARLLAI